MNITQEHWSEREIVCNILSVIYKGFIAYSSKHITKCPWQLGDTTSITRVPTLEIGWQKVVDGLIHLTHENSRLNCELTEVFLQYLPIAERVMEAFL